MPITVTAGGHGLGERMGVGEKVGWSKGVSITYLKRMDASEFDNMKSKTNFFNVLYLQMATAATRNAIATILVYGCMLSCVRAVFVCVRAL